MLFRFFENGVEDVVVVYAVVDCPRSARVNTQQYACHHEHDEPHNDDQVDERSRVGNQPTRNGERKGGMEGGTEGEREGCSGDQALVSVNSRLSNGDQVEHQ